MKYIVYLFCLVLFSCKTNDLNYYKKKQMSNECSDIWLLLTKYMHRDKDGFLNMYKLPPDEYGFLNYVDYYYIPLQKQTQNHLDCFTIFTKKDIEKVFGKPTLSIDQYQYNYFIRVEKSDPCPSAKITEDNKYNLTTHGNPYNTCHSLYFHFDTKGYVSYFSFL